MRREVNLVKKDVTKALKLTSDVCESITERLQNLVATNENISTLAYAGVVGQGPCGCKGSCEGGCTSW